jgi:hypothetical protein
MPGVPGTGIDLTAIGDSSDTVRRSYSGTTVKPTQLASVRSTNTAMSFHQVHNN